MTPMTELLLQDILKIITTRTMQELYVRTMMAVYFNYTSAGTQMRLPVQPCPLYRTCLGPLRILGEPLCILYTYKCIRACMCVIITKQLCVYVYVYLPIGFLFVHTCFLLCIFHQPLFIDCVYLEEAVAEGGYQVQRKEAWPVEFKRQVLWAEAWYS